ncbi:HNH endonuclease [Sphingomonas edaphi]|uniref:HNH endonuclease n=1 Tax=Sphingomonas edaphi TaxID=2315689 RepID=A0A418Q1Z7_9SPHN|nr:HNH endonuclease [Sphingomonas edaphi]RIX31851.1 HNH endonuclease [Sphingomonas edaphi]
MWRPDHGLLAQQLGDHFGIALEGRPLPSKGGFPAFELSPLNCPPADAFRIAVRTQWRSLHLTFQPGAYAGELVLQMGRASPERRALFVQLAGKCEAERARISFSVNGAALRVEAAESWPEEWRRLDLALEKSPATVNTESFADNDGEVFSWTRRFTGLVLALVPLEEDVSDEDEVGGYEGLPEGAAIRVAVNRYERSRINRAACIELQGSVCKVCKFDFEEAYGDTGRGFIQVHHVTPVSEIGEGYRINPAKDLVPLCANCHSMVHRRTPPFTVDELREIRFRGKRTGRISGL